MFVFSNIRLCIHEILALFNLPFFFADYVGLDAVINGPVGKELETNLAGKGVTVLAWGENGFREITNSKRPIATPADLEGLKIRVVGTPIFIDTIPGFFRDTPLAMLAIVIFSIAVYWTFPMLGVYLGTVLSYAAALVYLAAYEFKLSGSKDKPPADQTAHRWSF